MTTTTSNARHILLRLAEPARLPDALLEALRDEVVLAGWLRGSGVLSDVTIRALGGPRHLAGRLQVVVLDGTLGFANGDVTCSLRAVLSRETDSGLETIAGELLEASIVTLEGIVTALDDVVAARPEAAPAAPTPTPTPAAAPAQEWAAAATAAAPPPAPPPEAPRPPAPKPSPTYSATYTGPSAMPLRPARPVQKEEEDQPCPEPGDIVEHFAFGRCEVVKSDGDRLHVRLSKDQRIKEIALEMLRVTPLPPVEGQAGSHYRLDRKL